MFIDFNISGFDFENFRTYDDIKIFFQGYVIWNDKLHYDSEFDSILLHHLKNGSFEKMVPDYNGVYNLVIITSNEITIATDRWGIDPIYYERRTDGIKISRDVEQLTAGKKYTMHKESLMQLLTFGFVFGNNTILKSIKEFPPHSIIKIAKHNDHIVMQTNSYWELELPFEKTKRKNYELEFVDLWQKQIDIYTKYLSENKKKVYMPFSGGLDCRLLSHELNKKQIGIHALTFGLKDNDEIISAKKALALLQSVEQHYILELEKEVTGSLFSFKNMKHRFSCAFPSEFLHYYSKINDVCDILMTGFSGDFMAGSHLKHKMKLWKNKSDIVSHIVHFKSPPYVKQLANKSDVFKTKIEQQLYNEIPDNSNLLSSFIRWDVEQRQRKYIARSAYQNEHNSKARVLLPFFDYKLMDFFLNLPLKELMSARLYTNAQIKYLYKSHPELIKSERNGKMQKLIKNSFIYEYKPKLLRVLKKYLGITESKKQNIYKNIDFEWLEKQIIIPEDIKEQQFNDIYPSLNRLYLYSISEAVKQQIN